MDNILVQANTFLNYKNIESKISSYFEKEYVLKSQIEEFGREDLDEGLVRMKDGKLMLPTS